MTAKLNPVYNILGYKMRLNWFESHHLYWGLLGMLISAHGFFSALELALYGHEHQILTDLVIGIALVVIQVLAFSIWTYVAQDDMMQHHKQVLQYDPLYHSPVHNFYGEYLYKYPIVKWLNRVVSKMIHSLNPK